MISVLSHLLSSNWSKPEWSPSCSIHGGSHWSKPEWSPSCPINESLFWTETFSDLSHPARYSFLNRKHLRPVPLTDLFSEVEYSPACSINWSLFWRRAISDLFHPWIYFLNRRSLWPVRNINLNMNDQIINLFSPLNFLLNRTNRSLIIEFFKWNDWFLTKLWNSFLCTRSNHFVYVVMSLDNSVHWYVFYSIESKCCRIKV